MLGSITVLLLFQLFGEILARAFDIAIPGPVIVLFLLILVLLLRPEIPRKLDETAT